MLRPKRPMTLITSEKNQIFRDLRDCLQGKGIRKHGLFLVSGERAIRDLAKARPDLLRNLILPCDQEGRLTNATPAAYDFLPNDVATLGLSPALFSELDVFGTHKPLIAMRTPDLEPFAQQSAAQGLEIICALGDPANLGALIRNAAAFAVSKIVLLQESASPFHPKAVRAASGQTLSVKLQRGPPMSELMNELMNDQMSERTEKLIALDMNGISVEKFAWPQDARILLGQEGLGVPSEKSLQMVAIPMAKGVESLNATTAASIALFSYRCRFPLT